MTEQKSNRKVITIPEAKEILEKIDVENADQIQKRTLDYLNKFSKTTPAKARTVKESLIAKIGLTESEAVELVNTQPHTLEELRVFTSGWKKLLPTEILEKILSLMQE